MNTNTKHIEIQATIVTLLITIIIYVMFRTIFTLYSNYNTFEQIMAVLLLTSEAYIMFHSFSFFISVLRTSRTELTEPCRIMLNDYPLVDILIPARHEPASILENTILACDNMTYPNKRINILDDSSIQKYKDEAEEIAKRYKCGLFRRKKRHGAKAGVINDCMANTDGKYVLVLDVDQNPTPHFLDRLVPYLESDPRLAFIQTPQYYSNLQKNIISMAANMQQAIFYENICESKSMVGAMMCCGTNVVLRREALEEVGGFDEETVTEDFATSLKLHLKNWKTIFYNHVGTFGQGPEDLAAYFAQQHRWSMGNVTVLKRVIAALFTHPRSLTLSQWIEYFTTSTYYLVSWSFIILMLCPIIFVFFGTPTFYMHPMIYCLSFMPYLILSSYIFIANMIRRHYHFSDIMKGQALFFLSLPVYLVGTFNGLFGVKRGFQVTAKEGSHKIPYTQLWPQILMWLICLSAITWGVHSMINFPSLALAMNLFWITYYFGFSMTLFYFNENTQITN